MTVKRIVANISTPDPAKATLFYHDILGLKVLMDHGWIAIYGNDRNMQVQISFATEGGSGTPVPDLSIEVDHMDEACRRMQEHGFAITYGPVEEPWGVKRFFVRDPFGKLVNILEHLPE